MKEFMFRKKIVLVAPVGGECNLRCYYCYHEGIRKTKIKVMDDKTLLAVIKSAYGLARKIDFLWHGGEPTLAGLDFYKKAVELQKQFLPGHKIENIIQTNGTLLTNAWAEFFAREKFFVSISLDGPKNLHNANRVFPNGKGSFEKVVRGINLIKQRQKVGILCIVSSTNVDYPEEIYDFMKKIGNRGFEANLCTETDLGVKHLIPSDEKSIKFFKRLFDLWFKDDNPNFRIRTFVNAIRAVVDGTPIDCSFAYNHCWLYLGIDENGDIYPCNRFLKNKELYMGSVQDGSLCQMHESEKAKAIYAEMPKIQGKCFRCKWWQNCGGGCAYDRWIINRKFSTLHPQCAIRQELFSYTEKKIQPHI
ncbi:SPASM domain-containing protein [Patescibacteria group bacterium]|nr:SPASM domain-containing protein [Patescibacteria group bacterium]